MPQVLLKNESGEVDVTMLVGTITWGGSRSDIARTLELEMIYPLHDYYTPRVYPQIGDMVYLRDEGAELFQGRVFYNERLSEQGTIQVTCYDDSIRLSKSKGTFNFKGKTAEAITQAVCNEVGVQVGKLAGTGIGQKMLCNGQGLFEIIKNAYEGASLQNKKKYHHVMSGGKLNVFEVGNDVVPYVLSDSVNITSSSYSENAESVVNRVKMYDENDKYIGMVQDEKLVKLLGVFQDVYTKEKDKQAGTVATNMIQGIEQTASIACTGHTSLMTGKAVQVQDNTTKLTGVFWIDSDTHTWSNSQYQTELQLTFKKVKG